MAQVLSKQDVTCLVTQLVENQLALLEDVRLLSVGAYNPATNKFPLNMSNGNVLYLDMTAVLAEAAAADKDKYVVAWDAYDAATNTGHLKMSDGTLIPVDLTGVIADAIATLGVASTTKAGAIEIATTSEAVAGTDCTRAITPCTLKAAIDAALADATVGAATTSVAGVVKLGNRALANDGSTVLGYWVAP